MYLLDLKLFQVIMKRTNITIFWNEQMVRFKKKITGMFDMRNAHLKCDVSLKL